MTLAGFLLGTVSGSGIATAVSLGSVAWPVLKKALPEGAGRWCAGRRRYRCDPVAAHPRRGRLHHRRVPQGLLLAVLLWAVPTLLYYLGIILAIEMDSRRLGTREVDVEAGRRCACSAGSGTTSRRSA